MHITDSLHHLLFYFHTYYNNQPDDSDKKITDLVYSTFEGLKLRLSDPGPFIEDTLNHIKNSQEKNSETAFIEALNSPHFNILKPSLSSYFQELKPEKQHLNLQALTLYSIKNNQEHLIPRCLNLLSGKQLEALFQSNFGPTFKLKEFAEAYLSKIEIKNKLYIQENKSWISTEIKSLMKKLLQLLTHYLNLLISSLESFTEAGAPKSAWDAAFQLEIYYRMLTIPKIIFSFVQERLPCQFQNQTAFILSLFSISTLIYSYRKWLEPIPEKIPHATNVTALLEHDPIPVFGRDVEIEKTVDQLMKNLTAPAREHPLIIGPPGVGKTKFLLGVAKKLSEKGITLHRIHASELLNASGSYTNKTVFGEILDIIKRHKDKIVLVVDDLQLLMKKKEKRPELLSLLETVDPDKNLPLFMGVTPIDFKQDKDFDFYEKEGYARRFYPIELKELKNSAVAALLKYTVEKKNPYFNLDPNLEVFNQKKNLEDKTLEPTRSLQNLAQLLKKEKERLEGEKEKKELNDLHKKLEEIQLSLTTVDDKNLIMTVNAKKEIEAKIAQVKIKLHKKELDLQSYTRGKVKLQEKEFQLKNLAEKIIKGETRYESKFCAEHFYLLPAKRHELEKKLTG